MKYLESDSGLPGGKCVGMFPKAWMSKPFPTHPHSSLAGGSVLCAEIPVEVALARVPRVQDTSKVSP